MSTLAFVGFAGCTPDGSASDGNTTTTDGTTTVDESSDSSMTSTETDTSDSADDSSASTGSFYAASEDIEWSSECDPWMQDCPEGEKCVAYASTGETWDANRCVPVLGDGQPGDPCTYAGPIDATDSCDASSMCWNLAESDGQLIGECVEFCQGPADNPSCPGEAVCQIANAGALILCLDTCDPLAQDCDDGFGCYWFDTAFVCAPTVANPIGEPCDGFNTCPAGAACIAGELLPECAGSACCTELCSLTSPSCSLPGTECVPFFGDGGDPPPPLEDVGICLVP